MSELLTALQSLHPNATKASYYSKPGKVVSVDLSERTAIVEPIDGTATIQDVRLQAIEGGSDGLFIVPKVGSDVIVSFINPSTAFVAMFSKIENYTLEAGGETLKKLMSDTLDEILKLVFLTNMGPTIALKPDNILAIQQIKQRLDSLFRE